MTDYSTWETWELAVYCAGLLILAGALLAVGLGLAIDLIRWQLDERRQRKRERLGLPL